MSKLILAATDGSDSGRKVVAFAGELARGLGAKVALVHVVHQGPVSEEMRHMAEIEHIAEPPGPDYVLESLPVPNRGERVAALAREDRQVHEHLGRQILADAAGVLSHMGLSPSERCLEEGDVADRILAVAERLGADVIVTGSRGLGPARSILGSVSYKVTHLAQCTCVIVK